MKKIISIGLILLIFSLNAGATGIAVSPARIEMDSVLKGTECDRVLTVFNTDAYEDTFSLMVTGDMEGWISLYHTEDPATPIDRITIPAKDKGLVLIRFAIPDDTASGEYTSKIYVQSIPPEAGGGQAAVMIRMPVDIRINVTGSQILTGVVKSITTTDTEVNLPLKIRVEFQNTGNVVAKPEIAVNITRDGTVIDSFISSETGVSPNRKEIIPAQWNTTDMKSGDYVANVSVLLNGTALAVKDLPFKILPMGTLTRQGSLTQIVSEGDPSVGGMTKILATFVNTGLIDTKAKFIGEVYRNGNLVDTIESNELLVPIRESGTLTSYLKIESPGSYTIKGHAEYGGRVTETKELSFDVAGGRTVSKPKAEWNAVGLGAIGVATVLVILIALMTFALIRRRAET